MTKWADCRLSDGHAIFYKLRHSDGKWLPLLSKSVCSRRPESETAGGGEDEAVPAAEHCVPSGAQAPEVETAQLRDLLLEGLRQVDHHARHGPKLCIAICSREDLTPSPLRAVSRFARGSAPRHRSHAFRGVPCSSPAGDCDPSAALTLRTAVGSAAANLEDSQERSAAGTANCPWRGFRAVYRANTQGLPSARAQERRGVRRRRRE